MSAEDIAGWVDTLTKRDAYDMADHFRAALRGRLKADGVKGPEMPQDTVAEVVAEWFEEERGDWDGLPALSPDLVSTVAPVICEYIEMFTKSGKPYGLMSVDDFIGIPHALRSALRGEKLDLGSAEKVDPSKLTGGQFNLRG